MSKYTLLEQCAVNITHTAVPLEHFHPIASPINYLFVRYNIQMEFALHAF